jgi:chromate transporter
MNLVWLYLLLVKATLTSFSGMTSLAIIRHDFVVQNHLLTDQQLTTAIAAGRLAPGPNGVYLVGIGYYLAGYAGAFVGWLALITPAFLSILLLRWLRRHSDHPAFRRSLDSVLLGSAGLSLANALPLAQDAIAGWPGLVLAVAAAAALLFTEIDSLWIVLGSALLALLYFALL